MRPLALGVVLALIACSDGSRPPPRFTSSFGGALPDAGGGGGAIACDGDGDGFVGAHCGGDDCDDGDDGVHPGAADACGDGRDQDCDGVADGGCTCQPGDLRACFDGPSAARGVGACRDGSQRCREDGTWGACEGAIGPGREEPGCDGIDGDCDGVADPPGACSTCPGGGEEICGNGLDDDCSGEIDDASLCDLSCADVDFRAPDAGGFACCGAQPPSRHSAVCSDLPGLPACGTAARPCLDLDGDPATVCVESCAGDSCRCGRPAGSNPPRSVGDCGYLAPCARVDCGGRRDQPCYGGPPATLGVGICHGGLHSCEDEGGARRWSACEGQQLPVPEICGNGFDDDCDGLVDEDETDARRACKDGAARGCEPDAEESCGDGQDDDCDGFADEACAAAPGAVQTCFTGPSLARAVGTCADGEQREHDGSWGPCEGEVLPSPEICGDGLDSDCDHLGGPGEPEDPSCCVPAAEICNGIDDDCDGLADEGLRSHCGSCGAPCYGSSFDELACPADGRTCERVGPSDLDPAAISRVAGELPPAVGLLYVAEAAMDGSSLRYLAVDTASGAIVRTFETAGNVIVAADGAVWSWGGSLGPEGGRLEHRSSDGAVTCVLDRGDPLPGQEPLDFHAGDFGVAPDGDAWIVGAAYDPSGAEVYPTRIRRVSAIRTIPAQTSGQPWPDGLPRCKVLDLNPDDPTSTDLLPDAGRFTSFGWWGSVVDPNFRLWTLESSVSRSMLRFDTLTWAEREIPAGAPSAEWPQPMPLLVDRQGAIRAMPALTRLDPLGPLESGDPSRYVTVFPAFRSSMSTADMDPDGDFWGVVPVSFSESDLSKVDGITGEVRDRSRQPFASGDQSTLAVDEAGRIWTAVDHELWRFLADGHVWERMLVADGYLSVGAHSTSRPLRDIVRHQGSWTQLVDPGSYLVQWGRLRWRSSAGPAGRAFAFVRFADHPAALDGTDFVCGPFEGADGNLSRCSGGRRFARIEVHLTGWGQPAARDIGITWHRP